MKHIAIASLLITMSLTLFAQDSVVLYVSPQTEAVTTSESPLLHEDVAEVLSPEIGLWLEPVENFRWLSLSPTETSFELNPSYDPATFTHAILTVWNWHNEPVAHCLITPEGPDTITIDIAEKGAYLLTLDGFYEDECRARLVRNIAASRDLNQARESWKTDEFFLGVCAFPGRYHWNAEGVATLPQGIDENKARALEAAHLSALGFQVVRTDESMEMGKRSDGEGFQFNFERMDAAVDAYTSRGFQLALQVMNGPDWAIHPDYADKTSDRWRYPRQEPYQRAYLRALLERYGQHARLVQIFNEPDQVDFWSGTPEEYVKHFEFSYDEVRRYSPDLPVINGGYCQVDLSRTRFFIKELKPLIEMPAYHSHGSLPKLKDNFASIRELHREAGYEDIRYLNTETGQAAWRADQERRMGQFVPQKTLYCWANQHAGVLLFAGRMTLGPKRHTQDFGFLSHYFAPRFAYGSMGALVEALQGSSFASTLAESDDYHLYLFETDETLIVAGFTLQEQASVALEINVPQGTLIDEMGNLSEVSFDAPFTFLLDGYPRYLVLPKPASVSLSASSPPAE